MSGLSLTRSLLRLAFPDAPAPRSAADLLPVQRQALEAIRDHGPFSVGGALFSNYSELLRTWGLPASRDELTHWLAGDPNPS